MTACPIDYCSGYCHPTTLDSKTPTILFDLAINIKSNTTSETYQVFNNELKQNSKLPRNFHRWFSSIFTAELIKIALSNVHKTNHKFHILFSDS